MWELWGALLHGGTLVLVDHEVSRDPDAFRALVAAEGVTVLNQTPSAFYQYIVRGVILLLATDGVDVSGPGTDPDGDRLIRSNSLAPNLLLKLNHDLNDEQRLRFSYVGLRADGEDQDFNQQEGPQIGLFPGFSGWGVGDILTEDHTARAIWEYDPADNPFVDLAVTLSYSDTLKRIEQGDDPDERALTVAQCGEAGGQPVVRQRRIIQAQLGVRRSLLPDRIANT